MDCARARTGVEPPRQTWPSMLSTACWSLDARATSASPDPRWGWGQCAHTPDPCTTAHGAASQLSLVEREADLERHLVLRDLPGRHPAAHLDHLEPPDVPDGGRGPGDRGLDGVGDAHARGADEFDQLVDVLGHGTSLPRAPAPRTGARRERVPIL